MTASLGGDASFCSVRAGGGEEGETLFSKFSK